LLPFGVWRDGAPGRSFSAMVTLVLLCIAILTAGRARRIQAAEPRPLSFSDAVEELAVATGRTIRYMRISTERCVALLAGQDVPEEDVVRLRRVVTALLDSSRSPAP
jgi:hypothetical protein